MAIARHHAGWLSLVEVSGPFVSLPVLERVFPQGLEFTSQTEQVRRLRLAYEEWRGSLDGHDPAIHLLWVHFVLTELLGFLSNLLAEGQALPPDLNAEVAEQGET